MTDPQGSISLPIPAAGLPLWLHTMTMLDSWTSSWLGGTRAMVRLAVTEMVVPEGLMVQRGGVVAYSSTLSGEFITAGLCG